MYIVFSSISYMYLLLEDQRHINKLYSVFLFHTRVSKKGKKGRGRRKILFAVQEGGDIPGLFSVTLLRPSLDQRVMFFTFCNCLPDASNYKYLLAG